MLRGIIRFFKELGNRVKVTLVGTAIWSWGQEISRRYNILYAESLGASAVDIGLLNSIASAVKVAVSIPIGSAVEKYTVKKMMVVGLIVNIVSIILFILAEDWRVLIPAFILHGRLISIMALADIIFITFSNPEKRSTVMSLSRVFFGLLNVFAPLVAAIIVENFGGINASGIRPLYYLLLVLNVIAFLIIAKKLQNVSGRNTGKQGKSSLSLTTLIQDYREFFEGERYLKRFVIIRMIRQFGAGISASFIILWMVNTKGATPYILGAVGMASILLGLVLQIPAGRLADKIGRKKAFYLFSPFFWLGTLLLIMAPSPESLILVGILGGVAGGAGAGVGAGIGGIAFVPFITMWWEMVPAGKRGRQFGLDGLVLGFVTIPASILGGILWDQGFKIAVLLFPVLLEALVAIPLLHTIPDTLGSKQ